MKKNEQMQVNELCTAYSMLAAAEAREWHSEFVRLNKCQAATCRTENFEVLLSYNTVVALYHIKTGVLVDILRQDYGYIVASAQHIAKFRSLMRIRYGTCELLRYYPVNGIVPEKIQNTITRRNEK